MGTRTRIAGACACLGLAACGGGGGGTGNSGAGGVAAAFGMLRLLQSAPLDQAVQIGVDATVELVFDAPVARDSLDDPDTWLRRDGSDADLPCSVATADGGRTVRFTPASPLQAETDYVFQLSPLTADDSGRILENTITIAFRTLDATPPTVLGADITEGAVAQSRTSPIVVAFSEAIAAGTATSANVVLTDAFQTRWPLDLQVQADHLRVAPVADLPGDRAFTLAVGTGVHDRAGNALATAWNLHFRTAGDAQPPHVTTSWPADQRTGASPVLEPTFSFSESMDPLTVEPSSLLFQDEFASVVPFRVLASPDQKTLRIQPLHALQPNRAYTLAFLLGPAAATDVSGNGLAATQALVFTTGSDVTPPRLLATTPANGSTRVSPNAQVLATFDEPLDPVWVSGGTVTLTVAGEPAAAVVELVGGNVVRVTPVLTLPSAAHVVATLHGGPFGLRDQAGNPLPGDLTLAFDASADDSIPGAILAPHDGAVAVPMSAHVAVVFDSRMDPATLNTDTVRVLDDQEVAVAGTVSVRGNGRAAVFQPLSAWDPGRYYRTVVRGGEHGVRETSGNWLGDDLRARFRVGSTADTAPPTLHVTLNAADDSRRDAMSVPPSGFTIDVTANDPIGLSMDMSSVALQLDGPGGAPDAARLFELATVGYGELHVTLPAGNELAPGDWTVTVRGTDLSGNAASAAPLAFTVTERTAGALPFERPQVVWLRTDLDRDGNGTADFDDDLVRLGFATPGDPAGTNATVRRVVLDGILAKAYSLLGRGPRGELHGPDSIALRYTLHEPRAVPHMEIALGGLDPEGDRHRGYGASTTGVLGRALYDARNSQLTDRDIGTSPGLGVFPAEMWLYQTRIHQQVWPSYQTLFAQRFLALCPDMGGTPVGMHRLDAIVLAPTFVYESSNSEQRARWNAVYRAADDWSSVIGVILAHEVGHAVGLVAPGPAPTGLFGDSSLHDTYSTAAEVMAATVGYESMVTLEYHFRDVDQAYLRQRLILR